MHLNALPLVNDSKKYVICKTYISETKNNEFIIGSKMKSMMK